MPCAERHVRNDVSVNVGVFVGVSVVNVDYHVGGLVFSLVTLVMPEKPIYFDGADLRTLS